MAEVNVYFNLSVKTLHPKPGQLILVKLESRDEVHYTLNELIKVLNRIGLHGQVGIMVTTGPNNDIECFGDEELEAIGLRRI